MILSPRLVLFLPSSVFRGLKEISWWLEVQVFVVGGERLTDQNRVKALWRDWQTLEQKRSHEDHRKHHLNVGRPRTRSHKHTSSMNRGSRMRLVERRNLKERGKYFDSFLRRFLQLRRQSGTRHASRSQRACWPLPHPTLEIYRLAKESVWGRQAAWRQVLQGQQAPDSYWNASWGNSPGNDVVDSLMPSCFTIGACLQSKPCNPCASAKTPPGIRNTKAPHLQAWAIQTVQPRCTATANQTTSSANLSPQEETGRSKSQSPLWGAMAAKNLAIWWGSDYGSRRQNIIILFNFIFWWWYYYHYEGTETVQVTQLRRTLAP